MQKAAATKATVRAATSNSSDEVVELRAENRRLRQELAAAHQLMAKGREEQPPLTREGAPAAVVAVAECVDIVPKPDRDQNVALTPGAEEVADEPEALDEGAIVEPRPREETHENEELSPYDPPAVALE